MQYRLLDEFRSLFEGSAYLHRKSTLGDFVALHLFEDLFTLGKSKNLRDRIQSADRTLNLKNTAIGKKARRGDGTFGERVPSEEPVLEPGFDVKRAPVANIEIGIETKIVAKAMIKQIDRVTNDLTGQVAHFKKTSKNAISVGIVGINFAAKYTSFEGDRPFPTDGKRYKHPSQEAAKAEARLLQLAAPAFDEFLILRYEATNESPFSFKWQDETSTKAEYSALLTRVSRLYDERF